MQLPCVLGVGFMLSSDWLPVVYCLRRYLAVLTGRLGDKEIGDTEDFFVGLGHMTN